MATNDEIIKLIIKARYEAGGDMAKFKADVEKIGASAEQLKDVAAVRPQIFSPNEVETINSVSKATDTAATATGNLSTKLGDLTLSAFGLKAGLVALAYQGVQIVKREVLDAIRIYAEFEASLARLTNMVKNQGEDVATVMPKVTEAIVDMSENSLYAANQLAAGMSKAMTRGFDVTQSTKVMAAAQELATARGIDLAQAEEAISKSIAGQPMTLRNYGISVDALTQSWFRKATVDEKVETISAIVHNRFANINKDMAGTWTGTVMKFGKEWDNLKGFLAEVALYTTTPGLLALGSMASDKLLSSFIPDQSKLESLKTEIARQQSLVEEARAASLGKQRKYNSEVNKLTELTFRPAAETIQEDIKKSKESEKTQIDALNNQKRARDNWFDNEIEKVNNSKQAQIDALDNQKRARDNWFDNEIEKVNNSKDAQIEALDNQKEARDNWFDNEIEKINAVKNAQLVALDEQTKASIAAIEGQIDSIESEKQRRDRNAQLARADGNERLKLMQEWAEQDRISGLRSDIEKIRNSADIKRKAIENDVKDKIKALQEEKKAFDSLLESQKKSITKFSNHKIQSLRNEKKVFDQGIESQKKSIERSSQHKIKSLREEKEVFDHSIADQIQSVTTAVNRKISENEKLVAKIKALSKQSTKDLIADQEDIVKEAWRVANEKVKAEKSAQKRLDKLIADWKKEKKKRSEQDKMEAVLHSPLFKLIDMLSHGALFGEGGGEANVYHSGGEAPMSSLARIDHARNASNPFLQPAAAASWERMVHDAARQGVDIEANSAYRTDAQQAALYRSYLLTGHPWPVAKPISMGGVGSRHERGLAVDIGSGRQWVYNHGRAYGWRNLPGDYPHFDFAGPFRQGLSYVPYDNFPAILDEGERVLTKEENANRGVSFNQEFKNYFPNLTIRTAQDIDEITNQVSSKIAKQIVSTYKGGYR